MMIMMNDDIKAGKADQHGWPVRQVRLAGRLTAWLGAPSSAPASGDLTHMLSPLLGNRGLKSDVGGSTFRFDLVLYLMKVRVIPEMMGDDPAMT